MVGFAANGGGEFLVQDFAKGNAVWLEESIPLQYVFKLADVSWPRVELQGGDFGCGQVVRVNGG